MNGGILGANNPIQAAIAANFTGIMLIVIRKLDFHLLGIFNHMIVDENISFLADNKSGVHSFLFSVGRWIAFDRSEKTITSEGIAAEFENCKEYILHFLNHPDINATGQSHSARSLKPAETVRTLALLDIDIDIADAGSGGVFLTAKLKNGPRHLGSGGLIFALRALRHRNYRLYFFGQGISLIGTWMTRVATSWLVYRLTDSALLLGIVGFAGQLPTFIFAPFAGVWADRLNRHRLLVATQTLAMLQSLALAVLVFGHIITVWQIIWLGAFQGLINAFDMPTRQAFVVQMVENKQDLGNAIALNSSMVNLARLIGPSIAGIIIAAVGEGYCFLVDGLSYVAVIVSLTAMRALPVQFFSERAGVFSELKEGWQYVVHFAPIRSILVLLALVSLLGMPYTVLMPIFAARILNGGAHTLGFLMAASGVGALAGAIILAARKSVRGLGKMIPIATAFFGIGLMGFSQSRMLWLSLILLCAAGFGMMTQMASSNTLLQTILPDERRGRVMSYYTMAFVGMAPFGSLLAGGLANRIGAPTTVLISGAFCTAGAVWFAAQLKGLRKLVRPIYVKLGIIQEVARGMQAASSLRTPPEE
jgi:MFS family permease